ncbi:MAG: polymer-forming cytoskeletal protein [Thermoanaerobaculia bacterium]|jgi:hypothetical protein
MVFWSMAVAMGCAAAGSSRAQNLPAIVVEEGSVARQEVVALGRDVVVAGEAMSDVVSISGSTRVEGRVGGDVIVLGGDGLLSETARIDGDVFVLGGRLEAAPGARIEGRSVSYPTVSSAWLTLMEGPSLGLSAGSPVILGAKLALMAAWLALTLLLFATSGRQLLETSESVQANPGRNFVTGVAGVLAMLLTALFFSAFAAAIVGIPLLILVVLLALMLKLWGMVSVFHATGYWLVARLFKKRALPLNYALVGLLVLGSVKLVPWVGTWVWTVATFIGVGSTLTTKFGRQEPWFDLEVPDRRSSPVRL